MAMEILTQKDRTNVFVGTKEVRQAARETLESIGDVRSSLALMEGDTRIDLPDNLSRLLVSLFSALGDGSVISIETTPEEVSASTAAEMLGISRPTFLKRAKEQHIDSCPSPSGKQQRFKTSDVLQMRKVQRQAKIEAFNALRDELDQMNI
ncbi:hypothetical protein OZX62_08115 [Bifidobacterium sp. ESL0690]|uniref:hypothetical protein n=1 Tax=Bifidobacterium sp. ESL0690 TaxID=2983214 RepID=UPI0023F9C0F1|nr:hypothetical protein [Bifidobacterium sp. ESL0690]WEV46394.1 hypothetical protein OZX62_08115 [Bifidobacterium sp. ESL0690]